MIKRLKALIKRTSLGQWYLHRRMKREFWQWTERDEAAARFYRQFVNPGDVVIDVGANRGNRSKLFLKLGASVVLVEPQVACVNYLKTVLQGAPDWTLIESALGPAEGEMEMLIGSEDTISTLSTQWLSAVQASGRFSQSTWEKRQKTRVTTLDEVIRRHGAPSFVKIDVEGYEKEVLSGLSSSPKAVSFEFTPECIGEAFACMDHLQSLAEYEFQLSLNESLVFESKNWLSSPLLKNYLNTSEALLSSKTFGDIYARKIQR